MSLKKRGNKWYVSFTAPNGQRIRESAGTGDRRQAEEYEVRRKDELWRIHNLGEKPIRTWQEAVLRWASENKDKKDLMRDLGKLRWIDQYLRDKPLHEISRDNVELIARAKEAEGACGSTINRYTSLISTILRKACYEWEWIDRAPKIRMRNESPKRERILAMDEQEELFAALPEHLHDMAVMALMTGLRSSNVTGLKWEHIHMDCDSPHVLIPADESKNGRPICTPLNEDAREVIRRQIGKHDTYVFTYKGRPITRPSNHAWYKARKHAGIEDFRWHDFRHTWASRLVQQGVPLYAVKIMGGWASDEVERYAHLDISHLLPHAEKLSIGTKLAQ